MLDNVSSVERPSSKSLRSIPLSEGSQTGLFDGLGCPIGDAWEEIDFPGIADRHAFAFEVQGDKLLPAYRDGDILIVSPSASVRRHDHVVLKTVSNELNIGILSRRTAQRLELAPLGGGEDKLNLALKDIIWLSRVVWAKFGS